MHRFSLFLLTALNPLHLIAEEVAPAPQPEPPPDRFFSELINMAVTLAFIVILLLIASWCVRKMLGKRMQQLNTRSGIKIIEQRALTQKSSIYVLEVYGKGVIIAESTNGVVHLGEPSQSLSDAQEEEQTT